MTNENNNQHNCDLLAAYEMGLLQDQDCVSFENHLPDCNDCMEELFAMAPAALEMRSNPGQYARVMKQALAKPRGSLLDGFGNLLSRLFNVRVMVPLALTAAVALFMINPFSGSDSLSSLVNLQALPYTHIDVRAGGSDIAGQDFAAGMSFYQQTDYCAAAPLIAKAVEEGIKPGAVRDQGTLYAGVSYLLCEQPDVAISLLKLSAASDIPPVAQKSLWYLGQGHLLNDNPVAAKAALESLSDSPVYGDQARNLLEKIKAANR